MKKVKFFSNMKERMKKVFIKVKHKDTSFFIIALCVCLISTAVIWRYTSLKTKADDNLSLNQEENEEEIRANYDPYEDYLAKVKDKYRKDSNIKTEIKEIDLYSMNVPMSGEVIKEFSMDNLLYFDAIGEWRVHRGLDIKPKETLMVEAAFEGIVEKFNNSELTGIEIVIDHGFDTKTLYNNLTSAKINIGDKVEKGQIIGNVGKCNSIESADGPHLHFELIVQGKNINPLDYISGE